MEAAEADLAVTVEDEEVVVEVAFEEVLAVVLLEDEVVSVVRLGSDSVVAYV